MVKNFRKTALLCAITLFSTGCMKTAGEWQNVRYSKDGVHPVSTSWTENGETFHKAHVHLEDDTLFIAFTPPPPYWEHVIIKVYNGKFTATAVGFPFPPFTVSYTATAQMLELNQNRYVIGDTLCGTFDITFHRITTPLSDDERSKEWAGEGTFAFQGTVREIVRPKDFNPFDKANFMTFDLPTALLELGEPLEASEEFNGISSCTWDASETRGVSDEGTERLTIDYIYQRPYNFRRWTWTDDSEDCEKEHRVKFNTPYNFESFSVEMYTGELAGPDFSSVRFTYDKEFVDIITSVCDEYGIDFGGHYTIAHMSCGCMCEGIYIIDRISGKITSWKGRGKYGFLYKPDSNLLIANSEVFTNNSLDCYVNVWGIVPELYVWKGKYFKKLQ